MPALRHRTYNRNIHMTGLAAEPGVLRPAHCIDARARPQPLKTPFILKATLRQQRHRRPQKKLGIFENSILIFDIEKSILSGGRIGRTSLPTLPELLAKPVERAANLPLLQVNKQHRGLFANPLRLRCPPDFLDGFKP